MSEVWVRCIVLEHTDQNLEFDLVFEDNCIKSVKLDAYQIRVYRGIGFRTIVEDQINQYFDQNGIRPEKIFLTFI
jgi:hypothetical protein